MDRPGVSDLVTTKRRDLPSAERRERMEQQRASGGEEVFLAAEEGVR